MPIQINGNGTITGISVGGLPNGIVDTDTLADGAATQAKRTYAIGETVQTVQSNSVSNNSPNGQTWTTIIPVTFTPKFSDSVLIFRASIRVQESTQGNSEFRFRVRMNDSTNVGGSSGGTYAQYYVGVSNVINFFNASFSDTVSGGTSQRTYNFQMYEESGGGLYIGPNSYASCCSVEEIKNS